MHVHIDTIITSKENLVCDKLSRGHVVEAQEAGDCGPEGPSCGAAGGVLQQAVRCADLSTPLLTEDDFFQKWDEVRALFADFPKPW